MNFQGRWVSLTVSWIVSMPLATLKMKSPLETFSFHCHQGQEMYRAQMDNIFGSKMVGEIPIFFWGRKMDPFGYEQQNSEFIAALTLPGENLYLSSFFKLVSSYTQTSFWLPNWTLWNPFDSRKEVSTWISWDHRVVLCDLLLGILSFHFLESWSHSSPLRAPYTLVCFPTQVLTINATFGSPGSPLHTLKVLMRSPKLPPVWKLLE